MDTTDLATELERLAQQILEDSAEIVAATATDYYRDSFARKAFDGVPWAPAKRPKSRGSLLVDSGALAGSIRPSLITPQRVVIAAGNSHVTYAEAHNEGFSGLLSIPAHERLVRSKSVTVQAHTRHSTIPQRRFMGQSDELDALLRERLEAYINSLTL